MRRFIFQPAVQDTLGILLGTRRSAIRVLDARNIRRLRAAPQPSS